MVENLSISRCRNLPRGFLLFAVIVVTLELVVFSRSYVIADMSTLSVTRTSDMVKQGSDIDMLILGAIRSLAVDAKQLETELSDFDSVYNYSVPSLGTSLQFAMILQKYLDHNRKPKVILLALGPETFGKFRIDDLFYSLWSGEAIRFRRFFTIIDIFKYMPWKERIFLVPLFFENILNSYSYRMHIRDYLEYHVFDVDNWGVDDVIERNAGLVRHMEETNGQMIYGAEREVSEHELYFENIFPLGGMAQYEYDSFYLRRDENIKRLFSIAEFHNLPVIVFFMPVPGPRYDLMQKYRNFDYIQRRVREFEETFKSTIFLDMDIEYDMPYFGDSSHLNARGAKIFNRELQVALENLTQDGYGQEALSGEGLAFEIGSPIEGRIRLNGFYEKEEGDTQGKSWRWSDGLVSSFHFDWLRGDRKRKIRVSFEVEPYIVQADKEMIVGTAVDSARVILRPGTGKYSVDLLFPEGEDLHLSVAYAEAASPGDIGASPDERTLSVRWFNIGLQYVPE